MLCGGLRLRPNKRIYYVSNGLFNVNNPIQSLNSTPHPPRGSNKHEAVITNLTAVNNHNFIRLAYRQIYRPLLLTPTVRLLTTTTV